MGLQSQRASAEAKYMEQAENQDTNIFTMPESDSGPGDGGVTELF